MTTHTIYQQYDGAEKFCLEKNVPSAQVTDRWYYWRKVLGAEGFKSSTNLPPNHMRNDFGRIVRLWFEPELQEAAS